MPQIIFKITRQPLTRLPTVMFRGTPCNTVLHLEIVISYCMLYLSIDGVTCMLYLSIDGVTCCCKHPCSLSYIMANLGIFWSYYFQVFEQDLIVIIIFILLDYVVNSWFWWYFNESTFYLFTFTLAFISNNWLIALKICKICYRRVDL